MNNFYQENIRKIGVGVNRLLSDSSFFISTLLILVAIASFGLGRQSVSQKTPENNAAIRQEPPAKALPVSKTPKAPAAAENDTYYVASKNGSVYHLPYCSGAKRISEANRVVYKTREEAEAAGLRPAANCPGL